MIDILIIVSVLISIITFKLGRVSGMRHKLLIEEREWIYYHVDMLIERLIKIGAITSKDDFLEPSRWSSILQYYFYLRDKDIRMYYGVTFPIKLWKKQPNLPTLMDYYSPDNLAMLYKRRIAGEPKCI